MTTNIEIKNAKPKDKEYSLNVATGLSILIKPSGNKLWRFRYSFSGKRCLISLGKYPQISMKEAKAKQRSNSKFTSSSHLYEVSDALLSNLARNFTSFMVKIGLKKHFDRVLNEN